MYHRPSWACNVTSELSAEHIVVVYKVGAKGLALAQIYSLTTVAVVCPEVERQDAEEVGPIFNPVNPGMGNHLIGPLLALSLN